MRFFKALFVSTTLLFIFACGSKDTLTGGPEDTVKPEIVSVYPEEKENISNGEIELVFNKNLDKASVERSIYFYPAVEDLRIKTSKSVVSITFNPDTLEDTNYFLTINKSLKDIRNNNMLENQTLIYSKGILNKYKIRGVIEYEDDVEKGHNTYLTVLTADSLYIFSKKLTRDRFEVSNLNPSDYFLRAYSDINDNDKYDFGKDPYFEGPFTQKMRSVKLEMAVADSTLPKLRSGRFKYDNQLSLNMSEELKRFESISIIAVEDSTEVPYTYFDIDGSNVNLITESVDTLTYKVIIENMEDLKGNIRERMAVEVQGIVKPDTLAPIVVETIPQDGRTIKTLNPEIEITFSEIIPKSYLVCKLVEVESGREIKLTNLGKDSHKAVFMPTQKLRPYYSYKFIVSKSTADAKFNFLKEDYIINFLPVAEE